MRGAAAAAEKADKRQLMLKQNYIPERLLAPIPGGLAHVRLRRADQICLFDSH
jgi:hypothetical protein